MRPDRHIMGAMERKMLHSALDQGKLLTGDIVFPKSEGSQNPISKNCINSSQSIFISWVLMSGILLITLQTLFLNNSLNAIGAIMIQVIVQVRQLRASKDEVTCSKLGKQMSQYLNSVLLIPEPRRLYFLISSKIRVLYGMAG